MTEVHVRSYKYKSGTRYWKVNWWAGGREHQRKFGAVKDAIAHRDSILVKLNIGGPSADELREFALCLQRLRQTNTATVTQVFDHFTQTYKSTTFAKLRVYTDDFIKRKSGRPKTLAEVKSYLKHLTKHFGHQVPSTISAEQLEAYLVAHRARPHREKVLRQLFRWMAGVGVRNCTALEDPPLTKDPFTFIRQARYRKIGETHILHLPEVIRLLEAAKDDAGTQALIVWCLFTGIRPEEARLFWTMAGHGWSRIDEARGSIVVTKEIEKTRKRSREMPIRPNLRAWLAHFREKGIIPASSRKRMTEVWEAAKIDKDRKGIFRHTYISHAVRDTPLDQVCLQCATSMGMIRDHYLRLVTDAEAKAFFGLKPAI